MFVNILLLCVRKWKNIKIQGELELNSKEQRLPSPGKEYCMKHMNINKMAIEKVLF